MASTPGMISVGARRRGMAAIVDKSKLLGEKQCQMKCLYNLKETEEKELHAWQRWGGEKCISRPYDHVP